MFVQRAAFLARYPASEDGPTFVDAILKNIKNDTGIALASQHHQSPGLGAAKMERQVTLAIACLFLNLSHHKVGGK